MVRATTGVGPDTDLTVNIYDDLMAPRASGQRGSKGKVANDFLPMESKKGPPTIQNGRYP